MPALPMAAGQPYYDSIVALLIFLLLLPQLFWLWMLYDCIRYEPREDRARLKWIVLVAIFGVFGALVYNVGRRKQRIRLYGR